ncbi:MAG: hypothetical protein AB7G75_08905 [Candidatus Binatia bacterium]
MSAKVILMVSLFIYHGRETELRQFETAASRIMRKYGGHIERVIRPIDAVPRNPLPYEVHIVTFPSMEQFQAYRGDAELAGLAALRQSAIARTEILIGEEGEPYL